MVLISNGLNSSLIVPFSTAASSCTFSNMSHTYTFLPSKSLLLICAETAAFLGNGFDFDFLLSAPLPPIVSLSEDETESLATKLMLLNHTSDKADLCLKARSLLVHIFSNYFYNYTKRNQDIPAWLSITCEKMKHPQNFIAGAKFMYELSGKSREHLTRCMLQYYHTTPTAYVTELRLAYAANLLLISNLSITDICYESGFENLSWFYKLFVQKYSMTPKKYRKNHLIKQPIQ